MSRTTPATAACCIPHTLLARFFLALLLLLILFPCASLAVTPPPSPPPSLSPQPLTQPFNLTENFRSWSYRLAVLRTDAPITTYLRSNRSLDLRLRPAFAYLDDIWNVTRWRRLRNDTRACNMYGRHGTNWPMRMLTRTRVLQLGVTDGSCYSKIDVSAAISSGEITPSTSQPVQQIFAAAHDAFYDAFSAVRIADYEQVYPLGARTYNRGGQACSVTSLLAHRVQGEWFIRAAVTNAPPRVYARTFGRHFLQEFIPERGLRPLHMPIRNVNKTRFLADGTTIVERWAGRGFSVERDSFDDPLDPLYTAYRRQLNVVDLSEDALTLSNIAILTLPLVLTLVPYALIAEGLNTKRLVAYIILTDFLVVVPFVMKGIELIHSAQPGPREITAFFTGDDDLGTVQSFVAECRGHGRFRNAGITFIIIGIAAMVASVLLEIWASRRVAKSRATHREKEQHLPEETWQWQWHRSKHNGSNASLVSGFSSAYSTGYGDGNSTDRTFTFIGAGKDGSGSSSLFGAR